MVPLLKFYFNEDVRASAAQALPEMLRSASLAAQKGMGPDAAYVRNMLQFVWGPLVEAVPKVSLGQEGWGPLVGPILKFHLRNGRGQLEEHATVFRGAGASACEVAMVMLADGREVGGGVRLRSEQGCPSASGRLRIMVQAAVVVPL